MFADRRDVEIMANPIAPPADVFDVGTLDTLGQNSIYGITGPTICGKQDKNEAYPTMSRVSAYVCMTVTPIALCRDDIYLFALAACVDEYSLTTRDSSDQMCVCDWDPPPPPKGFQTLKRSMCIQPS